MDKLEVFAIDDARVRVTGSIDYVSLGWYRRYWECGTFVLEVRQDIYDPSWRYICTFGTRPETGRIEKVEYRDTETTEGGLDTIVLSGRFMESFMFDKTFLVEERSSYEELVQPTMPTNPMAGQGSVAAQNNERTLYRVSVLGKETDGYLRTDASGNVISEGGAVVSRRNSRGGENGEKTIDIGGGMQAEQVWYHNDPLASYYWSGDTLHRVNSMGIDSTVSADKILISTKNEAYVENDYGEVVRAVGITDKRDNTYQVKLYNYINKVTRTVYVRGPWQLTERDSPYEKIDNLKHMEQWAQAFFQDGIIFAEPEFSGTVKVLDPSLKSMGELLYDECKAEGCSFRVEYDFSLDSVVFSYWRGLDRTKEQNENNQYVFSDVYGSLYGFKASIDTSNYKNLCYVLYDYDEPQWDGNLPRVVTEYESDGVTVAGYHIPYKARQGYETVTVGDTDESPRECFLDLRSLKPEHDGDWQRGQYSASDRPSFSGNIRAAYDAFKAGLSERGRDYLENERKKIRQLDTGTLDLSSYLSDFDLGDLVDLRVEVLGMTMTERITGVDELYTPDKTQIKITVGDQLLTYEDRTLLGL